MNILHNIKIRIEAIMRCVLALLMALGPSERTRYLHNEDMPIFLLGNGPSLSEIDLKQFLGKVIFACVNDFPARLSVFFEICPRYYFIIDPAYFYESKSKEMQERIDKIVDALNKVNWEMTLVLRQGTSLSIENHYIHVEYISRYEMRCDVLKKTVYFLYKRNIASYGGQNVMAFAIFYFICKNVGRLYIAGLDLNEFTNYKIDKDNTVWLKLTHVYGDELLNAIGEGFVKRGDFYHLFEQYYLAFENFYYIAQFALDEKVRVINFSLESFIDVFEKENWEENDLVK